jgi:hypothetical protein
MKGKERVIDDKLGIFGLHALPRMEEETTGNKTIWRNPIFDYWKMSHASSKRHGISHYACNNIFF